MAPPDLRWAGVVYNGDLDPRAMRSRVERHFSAAAMGTGYERAYTHALAGERSTKG